MKIFTSERVVPGIRSPHSPTVLQVPQVAMFRLALSVPLDLLLHVLSPLPPMLSWSLSSFVLSKVYLL